MCAAGKVPLLQKGIQISREVQITVCLLLDEAANLPPDLLLQGQELDLSRIAPGMKVADDRKHLPNCSMCWG
jgi:hypothetical protein